MRLLKSVHYAWIVTFAAMLTVLGVLGLARFAFGMVLPGIAAELALDYREQGMLGASYFLGYLVVVAIMPWLAPRTGLSRLCSCGLLVVSSGLCVMAFSTSFIVLSSSYFAVGLGSGMAFVAAMSLPSQWFFSSHRARSAGVALAGAGIGILVSGMLVPHVEPTGSMAAWRVIWSGFALANLLFALAALCLLRDSPADLGLEPYGVRGPLDTRLPEQSRAGIRSLNWSLLLRLGAIYAVFGAAGITYATFIVTAMIDGFGLTEAKAGALWSVVGALSIFSGAIFGYVSDRFGRRAGMVVVMLLQAIAYVLVASRLGISALYVSIALFGLTAWSMPSIIAAAAGDYLGVENAATGFAILTLIYAIGQVIGPGTAGYIAEYTGGFAATFAIAAGLNLMAVLMCTLLPSPQERPVVPA